MGGIAVGVLVVGCEKAPLRPDTLLPNRGGASPASHVLSGRVVGIPHGAAVGGTRIATWVETGSRGYAFGSVVADAAGRFEIRDLPRGSLAILMADAGGVASSLRQACAASVRMTADADIELELAPAGSHGLTRGDSSPALSGVVFERTPAGRRPVPGVAVGYDWRCLDGLTVASQRTDADGRYELCRLPMPGGCVWVFRDGHVVSLPVDNEGDTELDIDITRPPAAPDSDGV